MNNNLKFKVECYLTMEEMTALERLDSYFLADDLKSAVEKILESKTYVNEMQRMFLDEVTGEEKEMLTAAFTFKESE